MTVSYVTFMKHAEKVTKAASTSRPVLKGVYHASCGSLIVTDSHRLYLAKNSHLNAASEIVYPKTGARIDGTYPDVSRLIPQSGDAKYSFTMPVKEASETFNALLKLDKVGSSKGMTELVSESDSVTFSLIGSSLVSARYSPVTHIDGGAVGGLTFSTRYFAEALALFKDAGATEVTFRYYDKLRPFTLTTGQDDEILALLLPIRSGVVSE